MAKLTDARVVTLKGYFNAGDQPTELQFADLVQWIQEGIEEHDHDGTGDGDGIADLGPLDSLTMADAAWIGIGAALERLVFNVAGNITVTGAAFVTEALVLNPGAALTLDAAGAVTVTHSLHRLDTFGGAATDDLVTINGAYATGQLLVLRSSNNARDITVKVTGNIVLNTAGDFVMTNVADRIMLQFYGAAWYEISRSDNA